MAVEEFKWSNFWSLRRGDPLERRMFASIILILVLQLIFIANWAISWSAGGYLTTAGAIASFFIHFFGFYSIWYRTPIAQLLYVVILFLCCLLYIASAVLSLLSIVLNDVPSRTEGDDISTVVTFQLYGIAGEDDTQVFVFVLLIVINVIVVALTFALLFLVFRIRKLVLEEKRNDVINLNDRSSPRNSKHMHTGSKVNQPPPVDLNIPGLFAKHKQLLELSPRREMHPERISLNAGDHDEHHDEHYEEPEHHGHEYEHEPQLEDESSGHEDMPAKDDPDQVATAV